VSAAQLRAEHSLALQVQLPQIRPLHLQALRAVKLDLLPVVGERVLLEKFPK
jgi:hypothetical protein